MQGLLKLGKKLYEYQMKRENTFEKAFAYAKKGNMVSRLDVGYFMENYPASKSSPSYSSLADIKDSEFIKLVRDYKKYSNIIKNYEDMIMKYKNCGQKKDEWTIYQFSIPRDNMSVPEYNAKCKNWNNFLHVYKTLGYYYKKVTKVSFSQESRKPHHINSWW